MVATSLGVYKDERHKYQEEIVNMVGDSLTQYEASMNQKINDAKVQVDGAAAEKTRRTNACEEAEAAVTKAKAHVEECQGAVATAEAAVAEAEKALKGTKDLQKEGDKEYNALVKKKTKVEEALKALEGAMENKTDAGSMKLITGVGKEFHIDSTMLSTLPHTLKKNKAARGEFDAVILAQFSEALKKIIAEQAVGVDAAAPASAQRQGAVDTAKNAKDAAEEGLKAKEAALSEAREAAKGKQADAKSAKAADHNYIRDMKAIMDGFDDAKKDLEEFKNGPLQLFVELRDKVTPPPEPEAPADDAPAAAEDAPAAVDVAAMAP
jgi:chromosome segregation ATPase